jgi:hypothetical protein
MPDKKGAQTTIRRARRYARCFLAPAWRAVAGRNHVAHTVEIKITKKDTDLIFNCVKGTYLRSTHRRSSPATAYTLSPQ